MLVKYEKYNGPWDEWGDPTLMDYECRLTDCEFYDLLDKSALFTRDYHNPSQFYHIDLDYVIDECDFIFLCNGEEKDYKLCLKNGHEVYLRCLYEHSVFDWRDKECYCNP